MGKIKVYKEVGRFKFSNPITIDEKTEVFTGHRETGLFINSSVDCSSVLSQQMRFGNKRGWFNSRDRLRSIYYRHFDYLDAFKEGNVNVIDGMRFDIPISERTAEFVKLTTKMSFSVCRVSEIENEVPTNIRVNKSNIVDINTQGTNVTLYYYTYAEPGVCIVTLMGSKGLGYVKVEKDIADDSDAKHSEFIVWNTTVEEGSERQLVTTEKGMVINLQKEYVGEEGGTFLVCYLKGNDITAFKEGKLRFVYYSESKATTDEALPTYRMELGRDLARARKNRIVALNEGFVDDEGEYQHEDTSYVSNTKWYHYHNIPINTFYKTKVIKKKGNVAFDYTGIDVACHNEQGEVVVTRWYDGLVLPEWVKVVDISITEYNKELIDKGYYTLEISAEVTPVYKDLKKENKRESNQMFFRESLKGTIKLIGQDYYLVRNHNINERLNFYIYELRSNGTWSEFFRGVFNKSNCKVDYAKKSVTFEPQPYDAYTDILSVYEDKYNLTELGVKLNTVTYNSLPALQVYEEGTGYITTVQKGHWHEDSCDSYTNPDGKSTLLDMGFTRAFGTECKLYIVHLTASGGIDWAEIITLSGACNITQSSGSYKASFKLTNATKAKELGVVDTFVDVEAGAYEIKTERFDDARNIYALYANGVRIGGFVNKYGNPRNPYDDFCVSAKNWGHDESDEARVLKSGDMMYFIDSTIPHRVWSRLLTNKSSVDGTACKPITVSDISYRRNYKYALPYKATIAYNPVFTDDVDQAKWGRNDYDYYFTNKNLPANAYEEWLPVNKTQGWTNISEWVSCGESDDDGVFNKCVTDSLKPLRDAIEIGDAIQVYLNKYDLKIEHKAEQEFSYFLYYSESGQAPLQPNLTKEGDYDRYRLFITPISNILVGNYDTSARKAELCLKDILDLLCKAFRCYWYIEDGKLKIEHVSFFQNGSTYNVSQVADQIDITQTKDTFNGRSVGHFQSELEYTVDNAPRKYTFDWGCGTELNDNEQTYLEAVTDFIDNDNSESINVSNFSGDLDAQIIQSSSYSNEGFSVLIASKDREGNWRVPISNRLRVNTEGKEIYRLSQNYILEWDELVYYYLYDCVSKICYCNKKGYLNAKSVARNMTHKLSFRTTNKVDTNKTIKTEVGSGFVENVSTDIITRWNTVTLKYEPE